MHKNTQQDFIDFMLKTSNPVPLLDKMLEEDQFTAEQLSGEGISARPASYEPGEEAWDQQVELADHFVTQH